MNPNVLVQYVYYTSLYCIHDLLFTFQKLKSTKMSAYQSNLMWLQNRLSGADNWCSKSAAMMLDRQVLASIKDAFHTMESQVKLRLILSLFHLSHVQIEEFSQELSEILQQAVTDRDQWTSTVARIMVTLYSPDYLDSLKNANQYLADFFNNVTEAGAVVTVRAS